MICLKIALSAIKYNVKPTVGKCMHDVIYFSGSGRVGLKLAPQILTVSLHSQPTRAILFLVTKWQF